MTFFLLRLNLGRSHFGYRYSRYLNSDGNNMDI
nr:MAG TPA: hypothetical protein [Caudoviricetes sp.]